MKYLLFIICLLSFSCYNQKKAMQQFSRAATNYPAIPAQYCSTTFPVKETFIKGDSVIITDTLIQDGLISFDTLVSFDTITITKTITTPPTVITRTIHVTDTIKGESTAQLEVCQLERNTTLNLLTESQENNKVIQKRLNTRTGIMWSLILLVVALGAWKIYGFLKPKK